MMDGYFIRLKAFWTINTHIAVP